jgi:hypothetical protein
MARTGKAQRELDRAHAHREALEKLLANPKRLREWFIDWAESELRKDRFYFYSEKEHAVLAKELAFLEPCEGFAGHSIEQLIEAASQYIFDCECPEDAKLVRMLAAERPTELPLWQLKWLVGVCRRVARMHLPWFEIDKDAA